MTKLFRATFDTKKGGDKSWVIDIEAENKKVARKILEQRWKSDRHMFHINIRLLKQDEDFLYHWFTQF